MGIVPWFCQARADQHCVGAPKSSTQEVVWLPNLMIPVPNYLRFSINLLDCTQKPEEHVDLARVGKIKYITVELVSAKAWEQAQVLSRRLDCVLGQHCLGRGHLWHGTSSTPQSPAVAGFPHSLWGLELVLQCRACLQWPSARCLRLGASSAWSGEKCTGGWKHTPKTSVQGSSLTWMPTGIM